MSILHKNYQLSKEEALERIVDLETQMDNLFTNMSIGFMVYEIVLDSTGQDNIRVLMINQTMCDLLHADREKAVGKYFAEIWPGNGYQTYLDIALNVGKTGESVRAETYDDDLGKYINVTMYRPKIGQVAVVASDRTEMVKAEENLQKAYQNMSTILNEIPAPICVVKKEDGIILSNNPAFAEMCRYEQSQDMIGQAITNYLTPENTQLADGFNEYFSGKDDFVCDLIRANREKIQIKVFTRSLRYQNEDAIVSHFINLTKQQSDEKALRDAAREAAEASALKSNFLANMSHEIRTPMNGVIGFAELALRDNSINPSTRNYITKIKESGESLLGIINDILDVSKIESGKMELEMIPFDLHDIFRQCETIGSIKAMEKGIELYFYAEPDIGRALVGDPTKLRQVLLNLLTNGIKFTNKGIVKLMAKIENRTGSSVKILFEIKDSGIGMTTEQLEKIFIPFSQADISTTRKYGGTGLGLNISKNFVELMGGELKVTSALDVGSKFSFSLEFGIADLLEQKTQTTIFERNMTPPYFKADVMVCEDNEINQEVITGHLSVVGINPVIVSNGKLGLDMVKKRLTDNKPFDLIFMDVHMPVMDGMQAATRMKELGIKTPIIALTANAMSNDKELYLRSGMDNYLSKPFVEADLWNCLLKYLMPAVEHLSDVQTEPVITQSDNTCTIDKACNNLIIDEKLGLRQVAGKKELYMKVKRRFFETNQTTFAQLEEALATSDIETAKRICHTIKGLASTLGATRLQSAAQIMESSFSNGKASYSSEQLRLFGKELDLVLAELNIK